MNDNTSQTAEAPQKVRLLTVMSALCIGGAERVAGCLTERIDKRSFVSAVCYLKGCGPVGDQLMQAGVDVIPVPGLSPWRTDYLTALKLRRLVKARRIQVIHTHEIHGLVDGTICRLTTPGLRHVHTFHYGNYPECNWKTRAFESQCWRVPDALVAVGHRQAAAIRDLYRMPENRLKVIWNGVDDAPPPTERLPLLADLAPGVPVIASISTLIRQKGLEYLLEAAGLLRQSGDSFMLLVAGDGVLRSELVERAARLGLTDQVRFLGWVPEAARQVLPACDIFVQSSLWEAMSIVVLEAMAAGKPTVVTSVGENTHVVVPSETGLVVPPADPAALAEALRSLLRDPVRRAALGRDARRRYEQRFRVEHMVVEYERLYLEILGLPEPAGRLQDCS
jgi:glycosyltransferase involved in cell wall biosynthesis